jgi:hypothetical protein
MNMQFRRFDGLHLQLRMESDSAYLSELQEREMPAAAK